MIQTDDSLYDKLSVIYDNVNKLANCNAYVIRFDTNVLLYTKHIHGEKYLMVILHNNFVECIQRNLRSVYYKITSDRELEEVKDKIGLDDKLIEVYGGLDYSSCRHLYSTVNFRAAYRKIMESSN